MTPKTSYLPAFLPSKTFYLPSSKNFFSKKNLTTLAQYYTFASNFRNTIN